MYTLRINIVGVYPYDDNASCCKQRGADDVEFNFGTKAEIIRDSTLL